MSSEMNVKAAKSGLTGEVAVTAPESLADQITKIQNQIRTLRAQRTVITERLAVLEATATKLFAEASLNKKQQDFMRKLSPSEIELLASRKPK